MSETLSSTQEPETRKRFQFRISTLLFLILVAGVMIGVLTQHYRSLVRFRPIFNRVQQLLPTEMNQFVLSVAPIDAREFDNPRDFGGRYSEEFMGGASFYMAYSARWPEGRDEKVYVQVVGKMSMLGFGTTVEIHDFGLEYNPLVIMRLVRFFDEEYGIDATVVSRSFEEFNED